MGALMNEHTEPEEWRPVPSLPGVIASSWGRVHRVTRDGLSSRGRPAKPTYGGKVRMKEGYVALWVTWLNLNGEKKCRRLVSRLVCEAWHGPAPADKPLAMHGNDDPTDNRPSNLSWGSYRDNLSQEGSRSRARAAWVRRKARMAEEKARKAA